MMARKTMWDAQQSDILHQSMTKALKFGGLVEQFPTMVEECLKNRSWAYRTCRAKGREFRSPLEYFTHNEPDGVGTTDAQVRKLIAGHPEVEGEWRKAVKSPGARNDLHNNVMEVRKQGNSRAYALERLSEERPTLHAAVIAGDMSANEAMIRAGFRKKPEPFEQVKKLIRKLTVEQKRELIELLEAS